MNSYNKYAKEWAENIRIGKNFSHVYIEKPAMQAKFPDLAGKKVLCIGCGSGDECAELAARGATVVGIDSADELIEIARNSFPDLEFHTMDMAELEFPEESFDFVYSSLTMHYKQNWVETLQGINRVMKPEATFLFSTNHPATWSATTHDTDTYKARLLGYEWKNGDIEVYGDYFGNHLIHDKWWGYFEVSFYVKPLSTAFREIREAGFLVQDFLEPQPIEAGKAVDPHAYHRYQKLPFFAVFELKKA